MDELIAQFEKLAVGGVKVAIANVDIMRKALALLSELSDDVNITFAEHGMKIVAMDTGHVSLTAVKFAKGMFDVYSLGKETVIGVKVSNLVKVLSCVDGPTSFVYDEEETPDFFNISTTHGNFKMGLIDLDSEEMLIPDMDFEVEIDADSSVFQKHVKNLSMFGGALRIQADDEVWMSSSGDIGTGSIRLEGSRVKVSGPLDSTFSLKYINTFCKAANVSKTVALRLSPEQPLLLKYEFAEDSYISFFLAPRYEEDDNEEEDE
ncbi:putative DNA polymerase sliding clamp 2 [Acanthocystis turfacea Chlorella virus MO0605SPH]|nr:putative DNA polymerase sliding clamp 2 [Acanthocystis turfacea Chlorella virus MO0605SPH]